MKLPVIKLNKEFFIAHKEHFKIAATVAIVSVTIISVIGRFVPRKSEEITATASSASQVNPRASEIAKAMSTVPQENEAQTAAETEKTSSTSETEAVSAAAETAETGQTEQGSQSGSTSATTALPTTQKTTVPFATAIIPDYPADYNAQWDAGYLVAIDNPDYSYECAQVTLSDGDRDLLERLCNGEFGSGGFVGASLIAQAVKNAICFDGYQSVQAVITGCRYDGRTDLGTTEACRQAVRYIFDENHDAVQHRIMYMYNPVLVQSAFHESQNYIMTYQDVRFFDRWNY